MLEATKGCCPSAPPVLPSALTAALPSSGIACELLFRPRFPVPAPWPLLPPPLLLLLAPPPRPPVAALDLPLSLMLGCSGVCECGELLLRVDVSLSIDRDLSAVSLLFPAA